MKRVLLFSIIGIGLIGMMCMGLVALGLLVTPVRAQIGQVVESVFDRARSELNEPRVQSLNPLSQETPQPRPEQERRAQRQAEPGILISGVVDGSPADEAGLRRGDILLGVDGAEVNSLRELEKALAQRSAGDEVELLVQRGDEQVTLTATLADAPDGMPWQNHAGLLLGITSCGEMMMPFGEGMPFGDMQLVTGLRLTQVVEGSPADEAGLQRGDVLISADGQPLNRADALTEVLEDKNPGDSITFEVRSGEETREVTVELGEHPDQAGQPYLGIRYNLMRGPVLPDNGGPMPWIPRIPDGVLPDDLPFDGLPFPPGDLTSGALIQEVVPDSPAAKAGLEEGQVVQSVDGTTLSSPESLREAIAAREPGDTVTLSVYDPQSGETSEVEVTLGENPDQAGAAWLGIRFSFFQIETEETPGSGG